MNEELAKCPACDSTMMWPQPGNEEAICSNTDCGYQVNVWDHHVLARRAEVGRLVETLAERDEARAEVERLATVTHGLGVAKEAVEQHNEELRAEVEALTGKVRLLEAGRDERDARILSLSNCALGLRAEVERLKEERLGVERALQTSHDNLDERWSELSEAHSRIAALEAVIKAQSEHAKAIARSNWTAFELSEALHAAGLDAEPVRGDSI